MNNQFDFEEMTPPAGGLDAVRRRADHIALLARLKQALSAMAASIVVCVVLLVSGVTGASGPQLADGGPVSQSSAAPMMSGDSSAGDAPRVVSPNGVLPGVSSPDGLVTHNVTLFSTSFVFGLLGLVVGVPLLVIGLYLTLRRSGEPTTKPRFVALSLLAVGLALTVISAVKVFF